jgi:hypothetical protein
MGAEEGVAHGVEEASLAEWDAIFEDGDEEFREDAADVGGRIESGGSLGEFCLEGLVGGGVVVGFGRVDETESGIGGADGLGAAASGGGEVGAAWEGEVTNGVEEFHFGSFLKADGEVEIGKSKWKNAVMFFGKSGSEKGYGKGWRKCGKERNWRSGCGSREKSSGQES